MSLLQKNLNWYLDDGINLVMINDYLRNSFFEKSFINTVAGKNCIDVGFGTGLLSILALKHGAKHITAFESNVDRYDFGVAMIHALNLEDKIHLINERYCHTSSVECEVLFSETVCSTLWGEGFLNSIPRHRSINIIPGQCFVEFLVIPVSEALANRLMINEHDPDIFDPLVDVDQRFPPTAPE